MAGKLTFDAYKELVAEDLAWLRSLPRTLERDHIIMIVEASPAHEYHECPHEKCPATNRWDYCAKQRGHEGSHESRDGKTWVGTLGWGGDR